MADEKEQGWVEISLDETAPAQETSLTTEVVETTPETPEVKIEEVSTPQAEVQAEKKESRAETRIRSLAQRLRDAEEGARTREEALLKELNEARQARLDVTKSATETSKVALTERVKAAKVALTAAYNAADAEAIANSIEDLTAANAELHRVEQIKIPEKVEVTQAQPRKNAPPEALTEWLGKNSWFVEGPKQDRRAALMAAQIGDEMSKEGYLIEDPGFYDELDRRLGEELPRLKAKPVVAASSRSATPTPSGTRPGVVRLTADEVETAKFFGMTPQEFARAKIKQSKAENGYTDIL